VRGALFEKELCISDNSSHYITDTTKVNNFS